MLVTTGNSENPKVEPPGVKIMGIFGHKLHQITLLDIFMETSHCKARKSSTTSLGERPPSFFFFLTKIQIEGNKGNKLGGVFLFPLLSNMQYDCYVPGSKLDVGITHDWVSSSVTVMFQYNEGCGIMNR